MKIQQLHSESHQIGYPYASSHKEIEYYENIFKKINTGKSVLQTWKPTMICRLHEVDIGKVMYAGRECWVFTKKAKNLLAALLVNTVEYLPLYSRKEAHKKIGRVSLLTRKKIFTPIIETVHTEPQYLINLLNIKTKEVLDFEQSEFDYRAEDETIFGVKKLVFRPEAIKNSHMFKIDNPGVDFQTATFVSDEFKSIVEENNLHGLMFTE